MCISPNFIWVQRGPNWVQQQAACRQCWRCRKNRVNDYVGRAMCEASVSPHACFITLTYAPRDDFADKIIHPKHFQLFMKRLRNAGHKVRYLVSGEYGDLRDRAHFHAILFFTELIPLQYRDKNGVLITRGQTPRYVDDYLPGTMQEDWGPFSLDIPNERMIHIREWPHGHIQLEWGVTEKNARYVCEYPIALGKKNAWLSFSKEPALGGAFFAKKAEKAKELGVLPSTFEYLPPGGSKEKTYLMTGATRRDYLAAIGPTVKDRPRMSEWVERTFTKYDKARILAEYEDAQLILIQRHGITLPEPAKDEIDPDFDPDYVLWWLSQIRAGIDQPFDWCYPHSIWTGSEVALRALYGEKAKEVWDRGEVHNPKPRPAQRAVSGHLRGCEGQSRIRRWPSASAADHPSFATHAGPDAEWLTGSFFWYDGYGPLRSAYSDDPQSWYFGDNRYPARETA